MFLLKSMKKTRFLLNLVLKNNNHNLKKAQKSTTTKTNLKKLIFIILGLTKAWIDDIRLNLTTTTVIKNTTTSVLK
jgi:hypothetical protein